MFNFDGHFKSKKSINLGGSQNIVDKSELLKKAQIDRIEREQNRFRTRSILSIQRYRRATLAKRKARNEVKASLLFQGDFSRLNEAELIDQVRVLTLFYVSSTDAGHLHRLSNELLTRNNKTLFLNREYLLQRFIIVFLDNLTDSQWNQFECKVLTFLINCIESGNNFALFEDKLSRFIERKLELVNSQSAPTILTFLSSCAEKYPSSFDFKVFDSLINNESINSDLFDGFFRKNFCFLFRNESLNKSLDLEWNRKMMFQANWISKFFNLNLSLISQDEAISLTRAIRARLFSIHQDYLAKWQIEDEMETEDYIDFKDALIGIKEPHLLQYLIGMIPDVTEAIDVVVFCTFAYPEESISIVSSLLYSSKSCILSKLFESVEEYISVKMDIQSVISYFSECSSCALLLLCALFGRNLLTLGIDEPFPSDFQLPKIRKLVHFLKMTLYRIYMTYEPIQSVLFPIEFIESKLSKILRQIYEKDCRRNFFDPSIWYIDEVDLDMATRIVAVDPLQLSDILKPFKGLLNVLKNIPFVIPFNTRVQIFRQYVNYDRMQVGYHPYMNVASVRIRRNHIFEDGFAHLNSLGYRLKNRVAISFIDNEGFAEEGIDGGGVFKEFLTSLTKLTFNENYGIFAATPQRLLYPAPNKFAADESQLAQIEFLGRILGKALYEGILIDATFAGFFLAKWLGRLSHLDDLPSLDKELYQGLIFTKNFTGNVEEELGLNFALTVSEFGETSHIDLIPNGSQIPVTNINRLQYVYLVAHYKLNLQIAKQCQAFFKGLSDLINPLWLQIFSQNELQVLLGGASKSIDINDLKSACTYSGEFNEDHPTIKMFWLVVAELSSEEKSNLVKFVTSCPRPPLLGFKELDPPFTIRASGMDQNRLPTASTCINLLKLPIYTSVSVLKE